MPILKHDQEVRGGRDGVQAHRESTGRWRGRAESGQALLEMALVLPMMLIFVMGIVDFSRAAYVREVITNLAGEGSSLASRYDTLSATVTQVVTDAGNDLNMASAGCVIVTSVQTATSGGTPQVTGQVISSPCNQQSTTDPDPSMIGCYPATGSCHNTNATVPTAVQTLLAYNTGYVVYITEIFYSDQLVTPIGAFLGQASLLPTNLYSVAYFQGVLQQ
jgi:Flp pilus assembly protein TadG